MLPSREQPPVNRVKHNFLITDILQKSQDRIREETEHDDEDDLVSKLVRFVMSDNIVFEYKTQQASSNHLLLKSLSSDKILVKHPKPIPTWYIVFTSMLVLRLTIRLLKSI